MKGKLVRPRNVYTRIERIKMLKEAGKWNPAMSVFGIPKVKAVKLKRKGKSEKKKYGIVEVLAGHGVGRAIHEDPYIPNFGKARTGAKLVPGMVIAIEPMLNNGTKNVTLDKDGYTFHTADGKRSAHFEHTILITENDPEILTKV